MRKFLILCVAITAFTVNGFSQNNPVTTGSNNSNIEQIQLNNKTDIAFIAEKKVDVEILQAAHGVSRGFKFLPLLPFLPRFAPGVLNINASEIIAERNALLKSEGDILLNKKVERTYTGFLLIFWFEKIEVTGIAAKIKKEK